MFTTILNTSTLLRTWKLFLFILLHPSFSVAFTDIAPQRVARIPSSTKLFNAAANAMIRKAKLKEIDKLKEDMAREGDNHYINKFLETKEFIDEYGGAIPYLESVMNRYSSVTVMPEYNKKVKTGFILGMPEPEIMGVIFRDAGTRYIHDTLKSCSYATSS